MITEEATAARQEPGSVVSLLDPIIGALDEATTLAARLRPEVFANRSAPPYYASVGSHLRHVLDMFNAIARGVSAGDAIDLSDRRRGTRIETDPDAALVAIHRAACSMATLAGKSGSTLVRVRDDLGCGKIEMACTLDGLLCQAHSHAIHHFACIGHILAQIGADLPHEGLGYNPTSPQARPAGIHCPPRNAAGEKRGLEDGRKGAG